MCEIPGHCFHTVFTGILLDHSSLPPDFASRFVKSLAFVFTRYLQAFCSIAAHSSLPPDGRFVKSLGHGAPKGGRLAICQGRAGLSDEKRLPKKWREWPATPLSKAEARVYGRKRPARAAGSGAGGLDSPGRLASFGAAGAPKGGRLASFEALERPAGLAIVEALRRPGGQALEAARSQGVWRQLWRRLPHVRAALWRWSIEKKQKAGRGRGLMFCPHRISIKQSLQQHGSQGFCMVLCFHTVFTSIFLDRISLPQILPADL